MSSVRAAYQSARSLLAQGKGLETITAYLEENFSHLTPVEMGKVASKLQKEIGILGRSAHDPNLYQSCEEAKAVKQKLASPHNLIATYRTPMCGSCSHNRKGSCGLIGGKLIAGVEDFTPELARVAAKLAVSEGRKTIQEATTILSNSKLSLRQKVASLNGKQVTKNSRDQVSGLNQSRVFSAMLSGAAPLEVNTAGSVGPGTARNSERKASTGDYYSDIDRGEAKKAFNLGNIFASEGLTVQEERSPRGGKQVSAAPIAQTTLPKSFAKNRKLDSFAEHADQVDSELRNLAKKTVKLLSAGRMTGAEARGILASRDELLEIGAAMPQRLRGIFSQLEALRGDLTI